MEILVVLCVMLAIAAVAGWSVTSNAVERYRILARTIDADEQNVLATLEKYGWRIELYEREWRVNGECGGSLLLVYRQACKVQQAREEATND